MSAPAATCWALIPIKPEGTGKTRLSGVLSGEAREALVAAMLRHVTDTARQAESIARTLVVGQTRHGLDADVLLIDEPGELNVALGGALGRIASSEFRPDRVIVVAGDLPLLTPLDLDLLAHAPAGSVAIAPDRHGTGTNAVSLPLPEAAGFAFHFGTDSHAAHRIEAERLGLPVETVLSSGLEKDIDEPADLADAEHLLSAAP